MFKIMHRPSSPRWVELRRWDRTPLRFDNYAAAHNYVCSLDQDGIFDQSIYKIVEA